VTSKSWCDLIRRAEKLGGLPSARHLHEMALKCHWAPQLRERF
jgi:hypothetical protein